MICIFCSKEQPPSLEHIFPLAIGGTITTDRVCGPCNSELGSRVDGALNNFLPIRTRRAQLGLAGNAGEAPGLFEILEGEGTLVGSDGGRIQTKFNKATGKLDHRLLYQAADVVTPDGKKLRQISLDARDKGQLPKIIQRERKRQGLPALSSEQLAVAASNYTTRAIENPLVRRNPVVSFAYLRHAMFKIAYELAFRWLGEQYLDDPLAHALRSAIIDPDLASTDGLIGYVGDIKECAPLGGFWTPHEARHLAYASNVTNKLFVGVRVFDLYGAVVKVSEDARRYIQGRADAEKLRFLVIDSVSRRTHETSFADELRRMGKLLRMPPLPDPFAEP